MDKSISKLKQIIAKYLNNTDNIFFHYKGRVSLYAILKAMGVEKDDEVIIPAFTCVVVPNPIIYLGAKPIYTEIDQNSYCIDISKLEEKITNKTKVIICQNTFGLSENVDKIVEIAKKHNLFTIEDCTHGFGGSYKNRPNGSYCDAAFYSMQWNKPFSSGIGGFCVINNPNLLEKFSKNEELKLEPGIITKLNLKVLFFARRYLLTDKTYWFLLNLYRWLSKNNIVTGSSSGAEISDILIPTGFFMNYSAVQAKEGYRNILSLSKLIELRKANSILYSQKLKELNKICVPDSLNENHSFLKYPILVKDRERFFELARKSKIQLGDWFNSPIHPVQNDFEKWNFDPQSFPVEVYISKHIVNLPTDASNPYRIIMFIEKYKAEIF